ncbi:MAG: alpha/beta hydrolase [Treponema sp.]|nr:alpha/beta hydrolase [Treponema sp.]
MERKDFTIESQFDGLEIKVVVMEPDVPIRGVVQFAHGMAEHKERYFDFMKYLVAAGFVTVIHDHRGHGESLRSQEDLGFFYDAEGIAVVEDVHLIVLAVQEQFPQKPYILFGHSMGSLVVRCYAKKYDSYLDKLIICGSPSKNSLVAVALWLTHQIEKKKGNRHRSTLLQKLVLGPFEQVGEKELSNSWLCCNREVVDEYNQNPLCGFNFTVNGYQNLFNLLKETYSSKGWSCEKPDLPIYFVAGAADPVISSPKAWQEAQSFMRKLGYTRVEGKLFDGLRHEILNELDRSPIFSDLLKWMMS